MSNVKIEVKMLGWELVKGELESQKKQKDPEMLNAISGLIKALNEI